MSILINLSKNYCWKTPLPNFAYARLFQTHHNNRPRLVSLPDIVLVRLCGKPGRLERGKNKWCAKQSSRDGQDWLWIWSGGAAIQAIILAGPTEMQKLRRMACPHPLLIPWDVYHVVNTCCHLTALKKMNASLQRLRRWCVRSYNSISPCQFA